VFKCLKFRSMIHNSQAVLERHLAESEQARAEWAADHKLKNDPRVTRFGAFLRSSSLDELPQLINVLKGEMSLVGPRPIVQGEVPKYDRDIAHYYRVSPGITGLWQVSGRNDVTYDQRVQMDSWYVRNWSLWHDIAIMCKTIPALLKRSGAY
jgi:lipopolysaccharide/colanic/teichoic acid biosynthesis glycosyltransferase